MGQQQTTMRVMGGALRRMILVLAVAALMAAMAMVTAVPALAAPGRPGPNSFEPLFDKGGLEENHNFGRCQSTSAKNTGPASDSKAGNPSFNDGDFGVCSP